MSWSSRVPLPGREFPLTLPQGIPLGVTTVRNPEIRVTQIGRVEGVCQPRGSQQLDKSVLSLQAEGEGCSAGEAVYTKHKAIEATADFFSLRSDCFYSAIPETLRSGSTREGSHGLLNSKLAPAGCCRVTGAADLGCGHVPHGCSPQIPAGKREGHVFNAMFLADLCLC